MNSDEQSKVERVGPNPKRCDDERVKGLPAIGCRCKDKPDAPYGYCLRCGWIVKARQP